MANFISNTAANLIYSINNSWTMVLLDQLMVNGSPLAVSDWEKQFMICLASHDQHFLGLGLVGIDITDFQWDPDQLEGQKAFARRIAEPVLSPAQWEELGYQPNPEIMERFLNNWKEVFASIQPEHIPKDSEFYWPADIVPEPLDRFCPRHGVFLHNLHEEDEECCVVCNHLR